MFFWPKEKTRLPSGFWLAETLPTSPLKPLNEIQRNLTESKISTSSTNILFFRQIGKPRWPPGLWLAEAFSTSLKALNGIQQNDKKQDLNVLYKVYVFLADRKNTMAARPPSCWDIFDFSPGTTERISTILDRKQDLNVLYQVCVFRADRKTKMATLSSDWLRHFFYLSEWNSTKLDNKQNLNVLYQVWVFLADRKNKMAVWPLIGWDIFDFSSETTEQNSTKLYNKQDLNVLYQLFFFSGR